MTPGWSQTSSRSSAPGRGPRSFFGRARTKVSWPSSSSAERSWRPTTGWPRLNHLLTTPTRIRPPSSRASPSTVRGQLRSPSRSSARPRASRSRSPSSPSRSIAAVSWAKSGSKAGIPEPGLAPGDRVDADAVDAVDHDLVHRRRVVGDRRHPERDRLVERQPEALPARGRQADVAARELAQVLVGRPVLELDHDPLVAAGRLLELARLAVDLAADQQPQVVARARGTPRRSPGTACACP